jgi:hypothetical protein
LRFSPRPDLTSRAQIIRRTYLPEDAVEWIKEQEKASKAAAAADARPKKPRKRKAAVSAPKANGKPKRARGRPRKKRRDEDDDDDDDDDDEEEDEDNDEAEAGRSSPVPDAMAVDGEEGAEPPSRSSSPAEEDTNERRRSLRARKKKVRMRLRERFCAVLTILYFCRARRSSSRPVDPPCAFVSSCCLRLFVPTPPDTRLLPQSVTCCLLWSLLPALLYTCLHTERARRRALV